MQNILMVQRPLICQKMKENWIFHVMTHLNWMGPCGKNRFRQTAHLQHDSLFFYRTVFWSPSSQKTQIVGYSWKITVDKGGSHLASSPSQFFFQDIRLIQMCFWLSYDELLYNLIHTLCVFKICLAKSVGKVFPNIRA